MRREGRLAKHVKSDILSLLMVLSVPLAIAFVFPFSELNFSAQPAPTLSQPICQLISIDESQQEKIMKPLLAAMKPTVGLVARQEKSLGLAFLPAEEKSIVLAPEMRLKDDEMPPRLWPVDIRPPSVAAPKPQKIAPLKQEKKQAVFDKEDLLKLEI